MAFRHGHNTQQNHQDNSYQNQPSFQQQQGEKQKPQLPDWLKTPETLALEQAQARGELGGEKKPERHLRLVSSNPAPVKASATAKPKATPVKRKAAPATRTRTTKPAAKSKSIKTKTTKRAPAAKRKAA